MKNKTASILIQSIAYALVVVGLIAFMYWLNNMPCENYFNIKSMPLRCVAELLDK